MISKRGSAACIAKVISVIYDGIDKSYNFPVKIENRNCSEEWKERWKMKPENIVLNENLDNQYSSSNRFDIYRITILYHHVQFKHKRTKFCLWRKRSSILLVRNKTWIRRIEEGKEEGKEAEDGERKKETRTGQERESRPINKLPRIAAL